MHRQSSLSGQPARTAGNKSRLVQFLTEDLNVGSADLALAFKHPEHQRNLPIILWQYGVLSAEQLARVFDWLERTPPEAR